MTPGECPCIRSTRSGQRHLRYTLCGFPWLIEHLIVTYPGDMDARVGYYGTPLHAVIRKEHNWFDGGCDGDGKECRESDDGGSEFHGKDEEVS